MGKNVFVKNPLSKREISYFLDIYESTDTDVLHNLCCCRFWNGLEYKLWLAYVSMYVWLSACSGVSMCMCAFMCVYAHV